MKKGLIFTDTGRLTEKFSVSKEVVLREIESYMQFRVKQGIEYGLLDVDSSSLLLKPYYRCNLNKNGKSNTPCFKTENRWEGYAECLDQYDISKLFDIKNKEIQTVFIIGGNDVIPVPCIPNFNEEMDRRMNLESDMPYTLNIKRYGYEGKYSWNDIRDILKERPKYNISRLPLPEGECDMSLLSSYFEKVKKAFSIGPELSYQKATCISCSTAREVTNRIMAHTTSMLGGNNVSKHLSPKMDINKTIQLKRLMKDASDSDMLVFVLHGTYRYGVNKYAGHVDINEPVGPIAFSPSELEKFVSTKIIACLCCWGARYINYDIDDSMLLTALNKFHAISFLGASNSVSGGLDCRIKLNGNDISYGEKLLQYYIKYITDGSFTAESLTKARYLTAEKYLTSKNTNKLRTVLTTIFEFGVYGDPYLTTSTIGSKDPVEVILDNYQKKYEIYIANAGGTLNAMKRDAKMALEEMSFEIKGSPQAVKERICKYVAQNFDCKVEPIVKMYYDDFDDMPKYSFVFKKDDGVYEQDIVVYSSEDGNIDDITFTY